MANQVKIYDPSNSTRGKEIPIKGLTPYDTIDAGKMTDRWVRIKGEAGSEYGIVGNNLRIVATGSDSDIVLVESLNAHTRYSTMLPRYGEVIISGNLKELYCEEWENLELDVTHATGLEILTASESGLESLDVTHCTELRELYVEAKNGEAKGLTELDVTNCAKLQKVNIAGNAIKHLDLHNCKELKEIYISETLVEDMDVRGTSIQRIEAISTPNLKSINAEGCKSLLYVIAYEGGQLQEVNVKGCEILHSIEIYENQVRTLNLDGCKQLYYLDASANRLAEIDIKGKPIGEVYIADNRIKALNVTGCSRLSLISIEGNRITNLALVEMAKTLPDRTGKSAGVIEDGAYTPGEELQEILEAKNWTI